MSEFLVKGLIKTDKYDASNDPTKMEASIALFDDLFETYDAVNSKMEGVDEDQWRTILHSQFRMLVLKYDGVFEESFLRVKLNSFAKEYLNIDA